jgi:hypothetical protein
MRSSQIFYACLLALSAAYAIVLATIVACRLTWPFELEWMEGGTLMHAVQLQLGHAIYRAPRVDFVPYFYTPLYSMVLAAASRLGIPLSFALGRCVSSLATLVTLAMLYAIGAREAGRSCGLLAACLYAALFRFCGAWYDLVRTDSLSMALVLGSALVGYRARHVKGAVFAAILLIAAFFAKQTAAVFAAPIALCLVRRDRRLGVVFGAVVAALGVGSVYAYNFATGGWFWFYVFQGHQGHRFLWGNFLLEYWRDVLFLAPMLLLVPTLAFSHGVVARWLAAAFVAFLAVAFAQRAGTLSYPEHMYYRELWYESPRALLLVPPLVLAAILATTRVTSQPRVPVSAYWLVMWGSGAVASALNHSTQWSYSNCFMPIAVFGSLAVALTVRSYARAMNLGAVLVPAAVIVQLIALVYDPRAQIPSGADRDALALLDRRVSAMEGPLFIPAHPFLAFKKTGSIHVHQMSVSDIAFSTGVPDLGPSLVRGDWHTVVVDEDMAIPGLDKSMYVSDKFSYDRGELYPKTGFRLRPLTVWRLQNTTERSLAPGITGNFEAGTYTGWTETGGAFRTGPATRVELGDLSGLQGARAASSRGAGSAGVLESDPFILEAPRISMLVAGTQGSYVRALRDDGEIARVQPTDAHLLSPRSLVLAGYLGQRIRLQIVDGDSRARGEKHVGIVVDDIRGAL